MRRNVKARLLSLACSMALLSAPVARAGIDQESNTDGFDPAADSFRINEARRQNAIARQLELKYRMMWGFGFDPANPPVDQPIGHESRQVGPNQWIYRPIYPELGPPEHGLPEQIPTDGPEFLPAPAAQAPPVDHGSSAVPRRVPQALPKPADAQPDDRLPTRPTAPTKRSGPREL